MKLISVESYIIVNITFKSVENSSLNLLFILFVVVIL